MERGLKYINSVEELRFISMFGNVVENTPRVALLLFKVGPFLNPESFFWRRSFIPSLPRRKYIWSPAALSWYHSHLSDPGAGRYPRPRWSPGSGQSPRPGVQPGAERGRTEPPDWGWEAETEEWEWEVQGQVRLHLRHLRQEKQGSSHSRGIEQQVELFKVRLSSGLVAGWPTPETKKSLLVWERSGKLQHLELPMFSSYILLSLNYETVRTNQHELKYQYKY